jgi:hypothetical protein
VGKVGRCGCEEWEVILGIKKESSACYLTLLGLRGFAHSIS